MIFDISEQKYIDLNLNSKKIDNNDVFESLKPNLMKAFSIVLNKDEQIFDLTFLDPGTLTLSLTALNQEEEEDLIEAMRDDTFDVQMKTKNAANVYLVLLDTP